jgi:hypothetical protein
VDGDDEDLWEDAGLEDAGLDEGTRTPGDALPSGALHIQLDTSPDGPDGGAAKPTKRPTQRKQPVRALLWAGALLLVGTHTHSPRCCQALRRANAGDKVFADYVHRAHLLCLLARALAADDVASEPTLAALVLSVLPPRVAWSLKALHPGGGVTAADMQALCEAFGTVFCILPSRTGAAPPPPPPGAHIPALGDTMRHAVYRAAARKNGDAEELSILFAALCRHWGIPCRTAHALFPQPLKPDARSLEASEGLSSNPAEWPRGGRGGRQLYPQRGATSRDFYGGAGPSGGRAPPRRPRPGAAAAPKPVAVFGPPLGGGGEEEPIDLTGDDDDDDVENADKEEQPPGKKSRRGRGRGDAELDADLQRAMAASLAGGASAPGAAVTPQGGKKPAAARKWTVGDAAWSRARGHIRHWVEVYIGGVPPHGAWVALFPWERVTHSAAKGKAPAGGAGGVPGTEALDITAVAEVSATAQAKTPLAYVIAAAGGGCRDVTRRYARQWSASQAARTHEPWWMDTLYGLTRAEAAATSAAVDVLAHPWPGAGAAVVAAEDRDLKAAVLKEPLPQRVADYKSHPLYALERHLTRYQAIWPRETVGSFNGEEVFPRASVQELHTADVWQRLHGRQVLPDQLATPAKVIPRRGAVAAAKKAANQPGGLGGAGSVGWGGTSGLGFDVAPLGTSFGDDDDYDAAGAAMDAVTGHEADEAEGEARGGGGGAPSPNAAGGEASLREDEKTILYGLWQTKAWAQPGAQGGKVPRNEYGNVDLLRGNPVPPGCVHLQGYARIGALAARLGIDAVPALTGFERHAGRMVPTLDGVIVAVENQQQLVDTWLQEEEQRNEKQLAKRKAEALKKWRLLVRTFVQKERLNADGAGPSGAAAAGPDVVCLDSDGEEVMPPAAAEAPKPPAVQRGGADAEVEQM